MSEPSLSEEKDGEDGSQPELPAVLDAVSVDLSAAEGLSRADQRKNWALSLVIAFAAHAIILAAIIRGALIGPVGAGGRELEAIHVDIVTTAVLESRDRSAAQADNAAPQNVDNTVGSVEASKDSAHAVDQKQAKAEPVERTAGPIPDLVMPEPVDEKPPENAEVVLTIAKERPETPDEKPPEFEPDKPAEVAPDSAAPSVSSEASAAAEKGGATARGVDGIEAPKQLAAAASAGAANAYAQTVLETLAKSRPRTTAGVRGTVRVGFTVARSGAVDAARVIASSGETVLDEAVLEAVRSVRFPEPPPHLAAAQLSYEIPYFFR